MDEILDEMPIYRIGDADEVVPARINDGGPIYPVPAERDAFGNSWREGHDGMRLRDWFAGQALNGVLAQDDWNMDRDGFATGVADLTYRIADALLAARSKGSA